jgi:hypothetical protein
MSLAEEEARVYWRVRDYVPLGLRSRLEFLAADAEACGIAEMSDAANAAYHLGRAAGFVVLAAHELLDAGAPAAQLRQLLELSMRVGRDTARGLL